MPSLRFLRLPKRALSSCLLQKWLHGVGKSQTRANSTEITRAPKVLERLDMRSLIRVAGPEATDFLQGLVTNDMRHFEDAGVANIYTLFLNTKGRVLWESIIYKKPGNSEYYIECDSRVTNDLQKHLRMYKIRRKVDIAPLENEMRVWSVFDSGVIADDCDDNGGQELSQRKLEGQIFPCGSLTNKSTKLIDDMTIYEDPRIPEYLSLRVLSDSRLAIDGIVKNLGFDVVTDKSNMSYRQFRYKLGIGEGIDDLPVGKALPLEINCDYLHGVSFHKGCYIGQELTARTHHTGVVRKRLMPLIIQDDPGNKEFPYDETIVDQQSGKVVGKFRGKDRNYGLGLVRINEALAARDLRISGCNISVVKPRWWPREPGKDKATADAGK